MGWLTAFGPDGTIGILELSPPELRVFDHSGRFLWKAGREGGGPGEFLFPRSVIYQPGIGWIITTSVQNRVVIFSDDGQSHQTRTTSNLPHSNTLGRARFSSGNTFWYWGSGREETGEGNILFWHLIRADWDSLQGMVIDKAEFEQTLEDGNTYYMRDTEHPRFLAIDNQGRAWWTTSYEYQIDVWEPDGSHQWRVRREYERQPYSDSYRHQIEDEPQMQSVGFRAFIQLPEKQPALAWLRWTEQNELWAFTQAYIDSPLVEVDVFDEEGVFIRAFLADKALMRFPIRGDLILRPMEAEDGSPLLVLSRWWIEQRK